MNRVQAEGLTKEYRVYTRRFDRLRALFGRAKPTRIQALDNVSFAVPGGHALGVIGDNGAGKSTLLRVLAGISPPTSGRCQVTGRAATLLDLAAGFRLDFTALDNLYLAGSLRGFSRSEVEALAGEILAFAELEEYKDLPLRTYSDGMRVRLGFAAASVLPADVLLVDEVLAVGDQHFQRKGIEQVKRFLAGGGSLVLVSHGLHLVANLCQEAIWLQRGRVEASGPAREVVEAYTAQLRERQPDGATAPAAAEVEEVRPTERADADPGERPPTARGSGEARIVSVRICDGDGREQASFATGEALQVEVCFQADTPIENPILGVALFRNDGVYVYGASTRFDERPETQQRFSGAHRFVVRYPALPLLGGKYLLSAAIYDQAHVFPYDLHDKIYHFEVATPREDHGLVLLEHEWEIE